MANFSSTNYEVPLAEVWKNYFDIWTDPPDCVISWLHLWDIINENSDLEKVAITNEEGGERLNISVDSVKKRDQVPNILVFKPSSIQQEDLEKHTQNGIKLSNSPEIPSYSITSCHEYDMFLFALTANDPLGQRVSSEENKKANDSLWQDLLEFKRRTELKNRYEILPFHGAGFLDNGTDWKERKFYFEFCNADKILYDEKLSEFVESNFPSPEQGFLVAISSRKSGVYDENIFVNQTGDTIDDLRNCILRLAHKYQQGAIYEFRKNGQTGIIRLTVPVCIPDCESHVQLDACSLRIFQKQTSFISSE